MNTKISLHKLKEEYTSSDIFNDDENIYILKGIINELSPLEQEVLLNYIDVKSYRKVADMMNCSSTTIMNLVKKIKNKIINDYSLWQKRKKVMD